jgi:hypothetical protein
VFAQESVFLLQTTLNTMRKIIFGFSILIAILIGSCTTQQGDTTDSGSSTGNKTAEKKEKTSANINNDAALQNKPSTPEQLKEVRDNKGEAGQVKKGGSVQENQKNTDEPKAIAKQSPTLKSEAKKFCDFFKTVDDPSQTFTVPADKVREVTGDAGTVISINPEDLSTLSNEPVAKNIEIELKELTNQQQLLKANAQTVCAGKLLVSGGAYYINLKSDGQQLKLKPGKSLSVKFPKLSKDPMTLFAGYHDTLGEMQWSQRKQTFRPNNADQAWRDTRNVMVQYDGDVLEIDTLAKRKPKVKTEKEKQKEQAYDKLYAAMEIQSLGWINCDRFYKIPDKTNVSFKFDPREGIVFASIYLIFDEINSVAQTYYGAMENGSANPGFQDMPLGAKVRLVAFSLKDNKMMAHSSTLTIGKNETVYISMKETSDAELKAMVEKK